MHRAGCLGPASVVPALGDRCTHSDPHFPTSPHCPQHVMAGVHLNALSTSPVKQCQWKSTTCLRVEKTHFVDSVTPRGTTGGRLGVCAAPALKWTRLKPCMRKVTKQKDRSDSASRVLVQTAEP